MCVVIVGGWWPTKYMSVLKLVNIRPTFHYYVWLQNSSFFFSSALGTTPLTATAAMPSSSMRIFYGEASEGLVAENVKIGDPLSLVISIDEQVSVWKYWFPVESICSFASIGGCGNNQLRMRLFLEHVQISIQRETNQVVSGTIGLSSVQVWLETQCCSWVGVELQMAGTSLSRVAVWAIGIVVLPNFCKSGRLKWSGHNNSATHRY